jgi:hypothetical protein
MRLMRLSLQKHCFGGLPNYVKPREGLPDEAEVRQGVQVTYNLRWPVDSRVRAKTRLLITLSLLASY